MNQPINHSDVPVLSLTELVRASFEKLGYQQLNAIELDANNDVLVMKGTLGSFYLKQIAQSVAIKVPGVRSVDNQIEVR